jgi:hypothetical protein
MDAPAIPTVIEQVLNQPTPEVLAKLQPLLLAMGSPQALAAHDIAGQFYLYLSAIRNLIEARQFPVLATTLAASSIGIGMAKDIFSEEETINPLKAMVDGLRVVLDILSNYQFVRQWEPSFAAVHDAAVWNLYQAYWNLSAEMHPGLSVVKRAELLENLFSIVRNPESESALRLALLVRLFQWGLIARLLPLLQSVRSS